jgi:hypothetical protein
MGLAYPALIKRILDLGLRWKPAVSLSDRVTSGSF